MRWGGGFIYNKLFFSFYNIGNIGIYKNISFYTNKNKIKNTKGFTNINYNSRITSIYNKLNKNLKVLNTTYFYFENLNKKESYNSTFKENILKLFNTFENRFNESILFNKKVYRNYMIDNNSIYNRYFINKKIDVYKKCLLNSTQYLNYIYNNNVFEGSYNSNFYNSYKHMFENKKEYLNNIKTLYYKNLINIGEFNNKYINTNYFRKLSKYFVENNKICSTNTDIRKQNLYNNTYKTQIEITKNLDYDFIFDKIKEMITDEMIFMCDIK